MVVDITNERFSRIAAELERSGFEVHQTELTEQLVIALIAGPIVATIVNRPKVGIGISISLESFCMDVADLVATVSRFGPVVIMEPFFFDGVDTVHGDEALAAYSSSLGVFE